MNVIERINRALEDSPSMAISVPPTITVDTLHPYLRDAVITCLPDMTDDQLRRIEAQVLITSPHALSSRLTDCTVLVQGIGVTAESSLSADKATWARMDVGVRAALCRPNDVNTRITSIGVSPASWSD